MSFQQNSEALRSTWSALQEQWSQTHDSWRDSVAIRFEREYWQEFDEALPAALAALEELEEILAGAQAATRED